MKSNKIDFAKYKPAKTVKNSTLNKDKLLKEKINNAAKSIRKKYLALKLGKADEDETINRLLSPVIKPLKELTHKITPQEYYTKYVSKNEPKERKNKEEQSNPDDIYSDEESAFDLFFKQYQPLVRQYIEGYFTRRKDYDETYGVKIDLQTNKLYLGNAELEINHDSEIKIGDKTYEGSTGLYSLLFMKHPKEYSKKDLDDYKEILQITSAHKRNHDHSEQLAGSRSSKYTKIIKPLFEGETKRKSFHSPVSGSGINMVYNEKPIEYVYWDDVNELVDRLRLLNASKLAGNTDSHDNEISAIINELREAGVIY